MTGHQYVDAILAWLNDDGRRSMLEKLNVQRHQYQSEFARRCINDGRREVLVKQLGLRFHELPAWAVQQLLAADEADLDRWTERVITAATIDDVFAGAVPVAESDPTAWNIETDFVRICVKAGRIEGQQHMMRKLLALKFGELPGWALSQLRFALEPDIELWTERVFTATTLHDVLAD